MPYTTTRNSTAEVMQRAEVMSVARVMQSECDLWMGSCGNMLSLIHSRHPVTEITEPQLV